MIRNVKIRNFLKCLSLLFEVDELGFSMGEIKRHVLPK